MVSAELNIGWGCLVPGAGRDTRAQLKGMQGGCQEKGEGKKGQAGKRILDANPSL